LLLDEVTSAINSQMANFVINLLQNFKNSMAIILISHTDKYLQIADKQIENMLIYLYVVNGVFRTLTTYK
jgi:ABC-type lipoprotein export system ATPase subunit